VVLAIDCGLAECEKEAGESQKGVTKGGRVTYVLFAA